MPYSFEETMISINRYQYDSIEMIEKWKELIEPIEKDIDFNFSDNVHYIIPSIQKVINGYSQYLNRLIAVENKLINHETRIVALENNPINHILGLKVECIDGSTITVNQGECVLFQILKTGSTVFFNFESTRLFKNYTSVKYIKVMDSGQWHKRASGGIIDNNVTEGDRSLMLFATNISSLPFIATINKESLENIIGGEHTRLIGYIFRDPFGLPSYLRTYKCYGNKNYFDFNIFTLQATTFVSGYHEADTGWLNIKNSFFGRLFAKSITPSTDQDISFEDPRTFIITPNSSAVFCYFLENMNGMLKFYLSSQFNLKFSTTGFNSPDYQLWHEQC